MSARSCVICSTTCGRRTLMATYDPAFGASANAGAAAARCPLRIANRMRRDARRCTWAMGGRSGGFSSMHERSRHGCPSDSSMVAGTVNGMGGTSARSALNASAYAGGMASLRFPSRSVPSSRTSAPSPQASWSPFRREARQHAMLPQDTRSRAGASRPDPLSRRASTLHLRHFAQAWPRTHLLVSPVQPTFDSPAYHGTMRRVHRLPSGYRTDAEPKEEDGRKRRPGLRRPGRLKGATRRRKTRAPRPDWMIGRAAGMRAIPHAGPGAIAAYASIVSTAYCPARRPPR